MSGRRGERDRAWTQSSAHRSFIRQYASALESSDVALFAGAGLSRAAGFVDWKALLKDIASDLSLDIDKESDLVAVAQYHVNTKRTRARINQTLVDELTKAAEQTRNHSLLARLPIPTVWTTNYDQLLERAFEGAGKVVDVKVTNENLAQTKRGRDVVLYKMHGCISHPSNAVLTKDDYEQYETKRALFVESLKGDLIGKTFLFLGFSFTDPNIDYILSRVRTLLGENQRQHFCVLRSPRRPSGLSGQRKADFEYERRKTELRQGDLLRFGIETVWIDEYEHLECLLSALAAYTHRKTVFVSGAAAVGEPLGASRLDALARDLGERLIRDGYRLVSGFGYGLGGQCILGALRALYATHQGSEGDRVFARPFPRARQKADQALQNTRHREDLLSRTGSVIVVSGSKDDGSGGVTASPGVIEEVEIALRMGKFVIPIGATGHAAKAIWDRAIKKPQEFLPGLTVTGALRQLGDSASTNEQLLNAAFEILGAAEKAAAGT